MTAHIVQIVTHRTTTTEVIEQDYELAKQEVTRLLLEGYHRMPKHHDQFNAACHRRDEARKRWLKAKGA